jgi:multiple sugar transport system substrate-binding protein
VFPGLRNRVAKNSRKPRLVPISCPILVCYYREDLLEQAGLKPPRTWSDYQTLLETLEQWAPGLQAVEPWGESFRATMFLARSAAVAKHAEQFSFCFEFRTGNPLIANPGFVSSLKMVTAAVQAMPAEVKTYLPGDCRREILEGRAAIAIAYETDLSQTVSRGEDLEIGICPLPGATRVFNTAIDEWVDLEDDSVHRVTLTGFAGWALAVSANLEPNLNAAAWELVRYMAIDQLPSSYPSSLISLCRDSQTANPSTWTGEELTTSEAEQYVTVVADALRSDQLVMEFPLIGQAQFREALTEGLTRALEGEDDAEAVLQSIRAEWEEISQKLGKEEVAKSYQRSH